MTPFVFKQPTAVLPDNHGEPANTNVQLGRMAAEEERMAARKKQKHASAPARVRVTGEAQQALLEVADELAALESEQVLYVNTDMGRAVSIALGAEPHIATYAEEMGALPGLDVSKLSRLRTYALAAAYANLAAQPTSRRTDLTALVERCTAMKQKLIVAAEGLAHVDLVDGAQLAMIKAGSGHLDTAADLIALGALFDVSWEQVEGKTFIEYADVEEAARLGTELYAALGARDHAANRAAPEAVERKHRAFTLLVMAYDEARRGLMFLRYHDGDVDAIAPSLYKRGKRKAVAVEEPEAEEDEAEEEGAAEATVDERDIATGRPDSSSSPDAQLVT